MLAGPVQLEASRELSRVRSVSTAEGITNPPIDELLERAQSKYALVIIAAKRARQINAYYSQLGEGLLEYVGPLVETAPQEKPLSIALREINSDLIEFKPSETSQSRRSTLELGQRADALALERDDNSTSRVGVSGSFSAWAGGSPPTRRPICCAS